MNFIQFAIDLGTTNSLIAQSVNGSTKVFKNPKGFKETLPSVVAFRKNGILVGDKARELKDKEPQNVFSSFKRKMGTDERFFVDQTASFISPIELSTLVLNELKTFLIDESPRSIVITIPASFDTIQSNATKEAGLKAGFEEVYLLQEPIAACLSVFNQEENKGSGNWLIYDLGGGTFDVAIVTVTENELKVVDHLGNNFLGGLDFDISIVNELFLPELDKMENFKGLVSKLKENSDQKDVLPVFNYLLFYAEQVKIELTSYPKAYVEFQLKNDEGEWEDVEIEVSRDSFNSLIHNELMHTVQLVKDLIFKNDLAFEDIQEIVLVGGSTYIPYVKELLSSNLGISINQKTDPTTAIVYGAAQYAGNKSSRLEKNVGQKNEASHKINLKFIYESQTKEENEFVIVRSESPVSDVFIRIVRSDKGYDSGKVKLEANSRFSLPLITKQTNIFTSELYSEDGTLLDDKFEPIVINQGSYVIDGQPLPNDICIEVDDVENNETKLEVIFEKNAILPLKKTIYKTVVRNLLQNSDDELVINILEGDQGALPSTNQVIGSICIKPKELKQNILKGSEIGISLEVSESRDLKINAFISLIDFEIENVFSPLSKQVQLPKLREELKFLEFKCNKLISENTKDENYEMANSFSEILSEVKDCLRKIGERGEVSSDVKYSVEEKKRLNAIKLDKLTRSELFLKELKLYQSEVENYHFYKDKPDFPERLKSQFEDIKSRERAFIAKNSVSVIREQRRKVEELVWEYRKNSVESLRGIFFSYSLFGEDAFTHPKKANELIEAGHKLNDNPNSTSMEYHMLLSRLYELLKDEYKYKSENEGFDLKGTGLS